MNKVRRFRFDDPLASRFIHKTVKHPLKLMIWGCFSSKGVGSLKICDGYMNSEKYIDVLNSNLLPSINKDECDDAFYHLDDSAPCHRTKSVNEWHLKNKINRIKWPGNSPDLNPIENLWSFMKSKLRKKTITTKRKLIENIIEIWYHQIPRQYLEKLSSSMKTRLKMVIDKKGGNTKLGLSRDEITGNFRESRRDF